MGDTMNCGIEVLKRLNEIINIDLNEVIKNCENKVNENGLSMYDLKMELNKVLPTYAIMSLKLIRNTPWIAFIGNKKNGHYVLVEKIDKYIWVYDPANKLKKCNKIYFYLLWSKTSLVFVL